MAPKASKMLVVSKKPAADASVLKRPAANGKPKDTKPTDTDVVSQAALLQLKGSSDGEVDNFVAGLEDKESQRLWKLFEAKRQAEGTDSDYKEATAGAGGRKNCRTLLKIFVKSGLTTKSDYWQKSLTAVSKVVKKGSSRKRKPLFYLLNTYYGPRELKARVLAGTIAVRPSPRDSRFPEFCLEEDFEAEEIEKVSSASYKAKVKADWASFKELQELDLSQYSSTTRMSFAQPSMDDGPIMPWKMQGKPALTDGPNNFQGLPGSSSDVEEFAGFRQGGPRGREQDVRTHAGESATSQILGHLENALSLASKGDSQSLALAAARAKGSVSSMITELECIQAYAKENKDKIKYNKISLSLKDLQQMYKLILKATGKVLKKTTLSSIVAKAAKMVKKYSSLAGVDVI